MALSPQIKKKGNNMKKFLKLAGLVAVAGMTSANAALTAPTIDTANFEMIAGAVLVATGVFFGIRKAISLIR